MESRACYGYYGEGHGCTGEVQPVVHKSGWRFMNFYFEVKGLSGFNHVEVKACDYAHAMKQLKAWARRDGFEIVGNEKGYENQVDY